MESTFSRLRQALPDGIHGAAPDGPTALIEQVNPLVFWGSLLGALESGRCAVLLNPAWPSSWMETLTLVAQSATRIAGPALLVPTSGSTGLPKFCIHNFDTLESAASGYLQALSGSPVPHCVNVLPQHHIGGLMPVFRSASCGGKVHFADYRDLEAIASAPFPLELAAISLVPTQLRTLLRTAESTNLLQQFALVLTGGAACPLDLLEQSRSAGIRLAPCYGSTETAAMVTLLPPEDFLNGAAGVGRPLPHVKLDILPSGRVSIQSASLFKGYLPTGENHGSPTFETGDIGEIDDQGSLRILGRADRTIITGGENVHPELIESAAMGTGLLHSAVCRGVEDPHWGSRIELWVDPVDDTPGILNQLVETLASSLPTYARPKKIHLKEE